MFEVTAAASERLARILDKNDMTEGIAVRFVIDEQGVSLQPDNERSDDTTYQHEGRTVMFVSVDGRFAGLLAVADPIKDSTPEAIQTLHDLGLKVIMLTGDNERTAGAVAKKLGIDQVFAGVSPQDKNERIKVLRGEGRVVAMAGDGINDAPALAEANVGVAMGTGTDVAIESAGVTLVQGDLRGIVRARTCTSPSSTTRWACRLPEEYWCHSSGWRPCSTQ